MRKKLISLILVLTIFLAACPLEAFAASDAQHVYSTNTSPIDFWAMVAEVPPEKQGTRSIFKFTSSTGTSMKAGVYLPYDYDPTDTTKVYNVVIVQQGMEPEGQITPDRWLKQKGKKLCDYLVANNLAEPFILFTLAEKYAKYSGTLAGLLNDIQMSYNVYGPRFQPADDLRNHYAVIGFSSGASYVKTICLKRYYNDFAYYGVCSCLGSGTSGITDVLDKSGLKMKVFFTSAGDSLDKWGNNEPAANRHAKTHQKVLADYAEYSERWTYNGYTHSDWQPDIAAVGRFIQLCFRDVDGSALYTYIGGYAGGEGGFTAYTPDVESSVAGFSRAYGWDLSKYKADKWTGIDGQPYERPHGHQAEEFKEGLSSAEQLCIELGIITPITDYGNSGYNIAAVAKAEASAPDNYEVPDGSNNVKYNTWRYGHPVSGDNYMWCANFVAWCANQCGYINSGLFNMSESVRGVFNYQTQDNGFDYYTGREIKQLGGSQYYAVPGDIFCFQFGNIGIVTAVTDDSIEITQGNTANKVMSITYTARNLSDPLVSAGYIIHVEYPANEYTIFGFLVNELGLPGAAAAGIMANLWTESHWNPNALGDNGTSYGLCQWHNERWERLKSFCDTSGYNWESNEGQLYYLKYELESSTGYSAMLARMRTYPDAPEGAYQAAYDFCVTFERPKDSEAKGAQRGYNAQTIFYPMFLEGDESEFLKICGSYRSSSLASSAYSPKLTPQQQAVVDAAYAILDNPRLIYGYYPNGQRGVSGTGYYVGCAGFIQGVYKYAGQNGGSGNAIDYWTRYSSSGSTSRTDIPIGACLVNNKHKGNVYGHIGIYVGNNKVIHYTQGKVQEWSLGDYMNYDGRYKGWVWPANIVLGTATG